MLFRENMRIRQRSASPVTIVCVLLVLSCVGSMMLCQPAGAFLPSRKRQKVPFDGDRSESLSQSLPVADVRRSVKGAPSPSVHIGKSDIPRLSEDQLELLADQVFDGVITAVTHKDVVTEPDEKVAAVSKKKFIDRFYQLTVRVTRVHHYKDRALSSHYSERDLGPNPHNVKHRHEVYAGEMVHVMMWEVRERPHHGHPQLDPSLGVLAGLEIGFVLLPTKPHEDREYRFFTQGMRHRMYTYEAAFPTAGRDMPAFEPIIPNGVQAILEDGTLDTEPMRKRKAKTASIRNPEL